MSDSTNITSVDQLERLKVLHNGQKTPLTLPAPYVASSITSANGEG